MSGVSVVIAAWNAERFIGEAVASVNAQTLPALEVIVTDDGSNDGTAEVAERLGATVLRCAHRGIAASRNEAIVASRGELIAFLDADDLWLPTKLEKQVAALTDDPELGAVSCLVDEFLDRPADSSTAVRSPVLGGAAALASGSIVRRTVAERVGPFDGEMAVGDWVQWWARLRRLEVPEHCLPEVLVRRRIHDSNNSVRESDGGVQFLAVAREHLRAKRSGA